MPYIETTPAGGDEKFYDELGKEMDHKYSQYRRRDPRVTSVIGWFQGVMSILFTAAVIWLANTTVEIKSQVAVLLARPEGISRAEYNRDETRRDEEERRRTSELERIASELRKESVHGNR
jgi:hypothetical protein